MTTENARLRAEVRGEDGPARTARGPFDLAGWRVDRVVDTREWDLDENKPIPGTGDAYPCDHCGRRIEVHVHVVRLDPPDARTIGTGCLGRALGARYAREARNAYEGRVDRAKRLLRSPWIRLYGRLRDVPDATLIRDGAWALLREKDRWCAERRANEVRAAAILDGR